MANVGRQDMKKNAIWMIVVLLVVVVSLLAAVLSRAWLRRRNPDDFYNTHWCYNRLMYVAAAKEQLQMAKALTNAAPVSWADIAPYMTTNGVHCLNCGHYTVGSIGESPACSVHGLYTNWQYGLAPYNRGYFVHIVKGEKPGASRVSPTDLLRDWVALVNADPECRIDEKHPVRNPATGEEITMASPGNAVWNNPKTGQKARLDFTGHGIRSREPDADTIRKMKGMAGRLGANLVGDDGRTY